MIVRISGTGQFQLDDTAAHELEQMDHTLTEALHASDEHRFHASLHEVIQFITTHGTEVPHDHVKPSDVIVPPEDVTMQEAKRFFTDEGMLHPLPA